MHRDTILLSRLSSRFDSLFAIAGLPVKATAASGAELPDLLNESAIAGFFSQDVSMSASHLSTFRGTGDAPASAADMAQSSGPWSAQPGVTYLHTDNDNNDAFAGGSAGTRSAVPRTIGDSRTRTTQGSNNFAGNTVMSSMPLKEAFELALSHHEAGRSDEAARLCHEILVQKPGEPNTLNLLGLALKQLKDHGGAYHSFRGALMAKPQFTEAQCNLANSLIDMGQLDAAVAACETVIAMRPDFPDAHIILGHALMKLGSIHEAMAAFRQAVSCGPNHASAHYNLGVALHSSGARTEAIASFRRAISINENLFEAHNNLAAVLDEVGEVDQAISVFRRAILLRPNQAELHLNLSFGLLRRGDCSERLAEYEWRLKVDHVRDHSAAVFTQPLWDGTPISGTLLITGEQGIGDTIQFIRYASMAARRCKDVVVFCPPELLRLFRNSMPFKCVSALEKLPHLYQAYCPVGSLPNVFQTSPESIPNTTPYLKADAADVLRWRNRLDGGGGKLNVGLCWAGNPKFQADLLRSPRFLWRLAPLGEVPGVRFISLQKGYASKQTKNPPAGMDLVDWSDELHDFADTAALVENLDLVISSCTSVPHLAGALGKPVWNILPFVSDWRWMLGRSDTPWYPSMRLFRQPAIGQWEPVMRDVAGALHKYVKAAGKFA